MLKLRFNIVAISLYLIPALLYLFVNNLSGFIFYQDPLFAIKLSIFFTIFGFLTGSLISRKINFKLKEYSSDFYINISKFLLLCGVVSIFFQLLKTGIPLFNNGIREQIQQGFLWNIFTFSSIIGLFISGYSYFVLKLKFDIFFKIIVFLLILFTFLTGWKGVLINYLLIFSTYFVLYRNIKISILLKIGFLFLLIFFGINSLRSGVYSISFTELFNYLFYGFENFVRIAPYYNSECLHSVPLFNCHFTYDNGLLVNPTFNVYTALMPLYADGGNILVGLFFFTFSFLLGVIKDYRNSLFISFLFYLLHYFFIIGHNGYIFNSGSFVISLMVFLIIDLIRVK